MNTLVAELPKYYYEYAIRVGDSYKNTKVIWSGNSLVKAVFEFSKIRTNGKYNVVILESNLE